MSLPFLSRATHDREIAALERLLAVAEQSREDARQDALDAMRLHELERRRYDELLRTVLAMKGAGATVQAVAGSVIEPDLPTPDPLAPLKSLIAEQAGQNYALRGAMLRQLAADVAAGIPHDTIEERITRGVSSDAVPI